jgi:hypothetical protein
MADKVNTQSVFTDKTFITLDTLTYFWGKTKAHVDNLVNPISTDVVALKDTVGDATKGLVKEVASLRTEVNALGGGEGGIQGMINASIAALDLPNTYDAKGEAAKAEAAAKSYADGLATNYDAAGSASAAEAAAKSYADGLATNYDAAGAASAVEAKLTTHTGDAVAHVTADERTAWNSAKTAIDAFLKDADMSEKAVDTLAELQTYMTTDGAAAAQVVERIGALEAINHDAYKAADETVLANAKSYADGLATNYDAAGAAATAKAEAIADAEGKYQPKGNYEAAGAAATAKAEAIADAEGKYQPKGNYEAAGTADAKIAALDLPNSYDAKGSADAAQAAAIAQAKLDAAEALKAYYTKTEVDNLLSTNSSGDRAYAKQYTDELFNSFVFAQNSDIDAIFTPVTE